MQPSIDMKERPMQRDRTNALARTADRLSRTALLGFGASSQKLASPKVGDKPVIESGLTRMATPKVGNKPAIGTDLRRLATSKVGNKPGTDTGPRSR
jgi:hypothetical protein